MPIPHSLTCECCGVSAPNVKIRKDKRTLCDACDPKKGK